MSQELPDTALELRSLVQPDGLLEVSLARVPVPSPREEQVLVRVEAAPLNPSDLGLLLARADLDTLQQVGSPEAPVLSARVPPAALRGLRARLGQSLPVGNEGAGVVVAAGSSSAAQALLGKTVSIIGGATYAHYRCLSVGQCLELPADTTPEQGASWFVNPMTALSMVEAMRREGHTALVHTAAASNLGQMLLKVCLQDGIPLVNIVRRPEQAALLRSLGASHVCDSSAPTFLHDLTEALVATSATIAFDAVGGGKLASHILTGMEAAANRQASGYSRYGSNVHKQVYIYGMLDTGPTELARDYGMAWGVGGFLVTPFLEKAGAETAHRLRRRVASELKTTFASHYAERISLRQVLQPEVAAAYARHATGAKYLITPQRD